MNNFSSKFSQYLLILGLYFTAQFAFAQCDDNVIELSSQAAIDAFATNFGCSVIEGDLFINGDDITNLNGLSGVVEIGDALLITNNPQLTNTNGLSNLTTVGGDLSVANNELLNDIDGLHNITYVGGNLNLQPFNWNQHTFGMPALETLGGNLEATSFLSSNSNGLQSLTTIEGNLYLETDNDDAFSNLTTVGGNFDVTFWDVLEDLNGFSNLQTVGGNFTLSDVYGVQDLSGFDGLQSVGGSMYLFYMNMDGDMGFPNLTSIGGNLFLDSAGTGDLDGFNALTYLSGTLSINYNEYTSIGGFANLPSVTTLNISYNYFLESIGGFNNLTNIGDLNITSNNDLSDCCIVLDWESIVSGTINIEENSVGCQSLSDITNACDGGGNPGTNSCTGNVTLNTQAEIDNFATELGCTTIEGNLIIEGEGILNLNGLSGITSIGGDLNISTYTLEDGTGLSNLVSVGGDFDFYSSSTNIFEFTNLESIGGSMYSLTSVSNNPNAFPSLTVINGDIQASLEYITNLGAFSSLQEIGGDFYLESFDEVMDLGGLSNLTTIGGDFSLYYTYVSNPNGLSGLNSVGGSLYIDGGDGFEDFSCFNNITTIGGNFRLSSFDNLPVLDAFNNISSIGGFFEISYGYNLTKIEGFSNLTTVNNTLSINGNPDLLSIEGFESINNVGNLSIQNNIKLSDCCVFTDWPENIINTADILDNAGGCDSVEEVIGSCDGTLDPCTISTYLSTQAEVDDFALNGCTVIEGDLFIEGNDIQNLDGLSGITSVQNDLTITNNPSLTNIDGLSDLTNIGGGLDIYNNQALTNVDGLNGLLEIGENLSINYNGLLSNIDGLSNLATIGFGVEIFSSDLSHIYSLPSLTSLGFLEVYDYSALIANPNGLPNLTTINGDVYFDMSVAFEEWDYTNLDVFSSLTTIGGNFDLFALYSLENVNGLSNLNSVGGNLGLYDIAASNLDGLNGITNIGGSLNLNFAGASELNTFNNLQTIGGNLLIEYCYDLESIFGFQNLESIGNIFRVLNNDFLETIYAFPNLASIDGDFILLQNDELTGFYGFNNLVNITGEINISGNYKLYDCCILKCLEGVANGGIQLQNNNDGCNSMVEVNDACIGVSDDCDAVDATFVTAICYHDVNQNGVQDAGEYGLFNQSLTLLPDAIYGYTDEDGTTKFLVNQGDYVLTWPGHNFWNLSSDSSSYNINIATDTNFEYSFGLTPVAEINLVNGDATTAATRCGFTINNWLTYENKGTTTTNGVVEYTPSELATFVSANPAPDSEVDGTYYWNFSDLLPTASGSILVNLTMPGEESTGEIIQNEGNVYGINEIGDTISIDKFGVSSELTCSYDPNDKLVSPSGVYDEGFTLFGDTLQYTVRFQNTGNDTAFNIIIRDTLDTDLDWSTFKVLNSSHDIRTVFDSGEGSIEFHFDNILLPDSNINEVASHGYLKYQILSKEGLPENTEIDNTAFIYFDFNSAIVTNTTENTMVSILPAPLLSSSPGNLDYGTVGLDTETSQTLTLQNTGTAPLIVSELQFSHPDFYILGIDFPIIIPQNNSQNVDVYFKTANMGLYEESLTVLSDAGALEIGLKANADDGTGFNNLTISNINIQPNPFQNFATLSFDNPDNQVLHIVIRDLSGKELFALPPTQGNQVRIDRNGLVTGMYLYELRDEKGIAVASGKFLVE